MPSDLTFLCVTKGEECVWPLLNRLVEDTADSEVFIFLDSYHAPPPPFPKWWHRCEYLESIESDGYIESILDYCLGRLLDAHVRPEQYILRLDDDESLSPLLLDWLSQGKYRSHPHWKFPRAHLWNNPETIIVNPPLWPDHQTRLSTLELSKGRTSIHCGSPFGGGELCPYPILHHKFLVKTLQQRQEIVARYEQIQPGAGSNFLPFSVPEMVFKREEIVTKALSEVLTEVGS